MDRRTLFFSLIIAMLVIALGVVGVLILRKRATLPLLNPIGTQAPSTRKLPTDTKPYDSLPKAQPWKLGDSVPTSTPYMPLAAPQEPGS